MPPVAIQRVNRQTMGVGQRRQLRGLPQKRAVSGFLYSTYRLPTALVVADYDLFTVPVGQAGQGFATSLTETQTNLLTGRRIPDQEAWVIREIGFMFPTGVVVADAKLILDNAFITIQKPDYKFVYGPPQLFPSGTGLYTANVATASNGWPTSSARVKLAVPILLDPGETFWFTYRVSAAQTLSATTDVSVVLFGGRATEIVQ